MHHIFHLTIKLMSLSLLLDIFLSDNIIHKLFDKAQVSLKDQRKHWYIQEHPRIPVIGENFKNSR